MAEEGEIEANEEVSHDSKLVDLDERYDICRDNRMTLRIWIPTENVGFLIGKGGASINTIRQKTSTSIHVEKHVDKNLEKSKEGMNKDKHTSELENNSENGDGMEASEVNSEQGSQRSAIVSSLWAPLTIIGTPAGCQAACSLVSSRCDDLDEVVAEFQVERSKQSTIIGPKGSTIRKLSADHAVRIYVPRIITGDRKASNPTTVVEKLVQLEGEFQNVFKCFKEVMDLCTPEATAATGFESNNWRETTPSAAAAATTTDGNEIMTSSSGQGNKRTTSTWVCPIEYFSVLTEKVKLVNNESMVFKHIARLTHTKMTCLSGFTNNNTATNTATNNNTATNTATNNNNNTATTITSDVDIDVMSDDSEGAYEDALGSSFEDNTEERVEEHTVVQEGSGGVGNKSGEGSIRIEGKEDNVSNAVINLKAIALEKQPLLETLLKLKESSSSSNYQRSPGKGGESDKKNYSDKKGKSANGKGKKGGKKGGIALATNISQQDKGVERGVGVSKNSFNKKSTKKKAATAGPASD